MNIIIDKNDNLFFDEYFSKDDLDKIQHFLKEELNIDTEVEYDTEREFKYIPALWKRRNFRDIDWTNPKNIIILLKFEDKSDDEILNMMGVQNRKNRMVITMRMRGVRQQFKSWAKELGLDDSLEEYIERFAKIYASKQRKTYKQIETIISQMSKNGCKRLEDDKEDRFPECQDRFNTNCLTCQFNMKNIKDLGDIERFNEVFEHEFE